MTYKELFQLKGLEKIKLHAGRDITSREILGAHVIELTDAGSWVSPGELIFVSGVAFTNVEEDLRQLIGSLAQKNIAGVVVEIGVYIKTLSDDIIVYADSLNIPLLSLPFEIPVNSIISQIFRVIYRQEEEQKSVSLFMRELVYGDLERALRTGEQFGFDLRKKYVPIFFRMGTGGALDSLSDDINLLKHGVRHAFEKNRTVFTLAEPEGVLLLDEKRDETWDEKRDEEQKEYFLTRIHRVEKYLRIKDCERCVYAGIGSIIEDVSMLHEYLDECRKVSEIAVRENEKVTSFSELGISRVFMKLTGLKVLRDMYQEYLGALIEYEHGTDGELMETLRMYMECDGSISDTTDRLFVHRNTVKYRLKRIGEILQMDITEAKTRFKFMLAFEIIDYLSAVDK